MGANARKINNARSQQLFDQSTNTYGQANEIAKQPYSDSEISNLRQRAVSPIQSAYAHSEDEIKRQAALGGGAPNEIAALSKNTRDRTQALSEGINNANAGISQMNLQGKLAGINAANQSTNVASGIKPNQGVNTGGILGGIGQFGLGLLGAFGGGAGGGGQNTQNPDDPYYSEDGSGTTIRR